MFEVPGALFDPQQVNPDPARWTALTQYGWT